MVSVGYEYLIQRLALQVRDLGRPARISGAVNKRIDSATQVLFPRGVAIDDSIIGHLEFAVRHEGVNLEVIDAVFEHLVQNELLQRLKATPTGTHIRRICFLWEWLTGNSLPVDAVSTGGYVDLFPSDHYVVADEPVNIPKFRVRDNALGTRDFCPIVHLSSVPNNPSFADLLAEADRALAAVTDPALYERALNYLYLSETRSNFAIERETPSANKQERFIQLLQHAGETELVTEDWLVELQNLVVRDVYSQETSYRSQQNWLEDSTGRVTFFPPTPDDMRRAMTGLEAFINGSRCRNPLLKAAAGGFGFVYLHPFMDGNGRLHRFLIQHALARAQVREKGIVVPVSAMMLKNIPDYLAVLSGFSKPVTRLWGYTRGDITPIVTTAANGRNYRYINFDREVAFLHAMVQKAIREEIPRELAWLVGYDSAFEQIVAEFDLPNKDISALIRMIHSNHGRLSENKRKKFAHLPDNVLSRIEAITQAALGREIENNDNSMN
ncbi:MAG: Fic family protein [Pseudomonadota bacterium]|nr:Fic family protein [Pseudomonadota bacterium]